MFPNGTHMAKNALLHVLSLHNLQGPRKGAFLFVSFKSSLTERRSNSTAPLHPTLKVTGK
jgi:hypothetical protein